MDEHRDLSPVVKRTRARLRLLDSKLWKLIRRYYSSAVIVLFLIGLALAAWSVLIEPAMLKVTRADLTPQRWPKELEGFKVVAISDIHAGSPFINMAKLEQIVELANSQDPDLTVLLGDYVIQSVPGGSFISPIDFAPVLGKLKSRTGVYAILGNHDWHYGGAAVKKAFEDAGISVIDNSHREISFRGATFNLVGIGDCFTAHDNLKKAYEGIDIGKATINITHTPDVFVRLPEWADIMFAGHTHGGQVNLPVLGPVTANRRFGSDLVYGHVVSGDRHIVISAGLGTSILPVRFMRPPEVVDLVISGPPVATS